ncbi:UNKNOWN [Stylonychia lemnae]|uniref:Lebercilin domain-containing protein n=1 Tax=Stylonychia lemnae TaxID=5949 RepID=A0A078AJ20_STYLE|nr:UNKNOWN [Stylonychia lemnae]|eukprot:CDW80803.1 UNKNOWN [Stylonychia lemnae]
MQDDDYLNSVNYNEKSIKKSKNQPLGGSTSGYKTNNYKIAEDDDDDVNERDYDQYDQTERVVNDHNQMGRKSDKLGDSMGKSQQQNKRDNSNSKSPQGRDKAKSTGNLDETTAKEQQARTFKLTLKQTLPRPQDISDDDKQFLLPKLGKQNEKLRDQVNGLLDLLENYAISFYSKKNDKYKPQKYQPDDSLKSKDKVLLEKLNKIHHYQKEIKDLRKQLSESYNIERLNELENEIKNKQGRIKELKDEEMALKRVQDEQQVAIQAINREGDYDEKIQDMVTQLRSLKKQYREIYYEQLENDKVLIEKHDGLVQMDHRVRKMQHQIKEQTEGLKTKKDKSDQDLQDISSSTLNKLKDEIDKCKQNHLQEERTLKQSLQDQEIEIEQLDHDVKVLELQVREKEQESRLADLKIKELKRSLRHKTLKPLASSPKALTKGKNGHIKYQSQSEIGSKVLKKKLENGRVTYQDVVLTEENVKLHEQKYQQQQSQRYYASNQDLGKQTSNTQVFLTDDIHVRDSRNPIEKLKGPQMMTPRMDQMHLNLDAKQQQYNTISSDQDILQPKRLGPAPNQGSMLIQQNEVKNTQRQQQKQEQQLDLGGSITDMDQSRNNNQQQNIYAKPLMMSKKKPQ